MRGSIHLLMAFAWVVATAPLVAEGDPQAAALLEKAREAHRAGDYPAAINAYEEANSLEGGRSKECLASLGWLYGETGQPDKAVTSYETLFDLSGGKSLDHLMRLTQAYDRLDMTDEAIAACRRFIAAADQEALLVRAHNELGYRLAAVGSADSLVEAENAFAKALELSGGHADNARLNLAEVLRRQDREDVGLVVLESMAQAGEAKPWRDLRLLDIDAEIEKRVASVRRQRRPAAEPRTTGRATSADVLPPKKIHSPRAPYTPEARDARIQGVVIMQAIIDERGHVTDVKVTKGLPMGLSESAVETVRTWRFEPATQDGEPVAVHYNLTMNFRLPGR